MRTAARLAAVVLVFVAARADAQLCPYGAEGRPRPAEHPGANGYCAPLRCTSDADCHGGAHCVALAMCIGSLPTPSGRNLETAWHACGHADACDADEHCEHARFCSPGADDAPEVASTPPPAPTPPPATPPPAAARQSPTPPSASPVPAGGPLPTHGASGCSTVGGSASSRAAWLAAAALVVPLLRRRSRR